MSGKRGDDEMPSGYTRGEVEFIERQLRQAEAERDGWKSRAADFEGRYEMAHASRMWAEECFRRVESERDVWKARIERAAGPRLRPGVRREAATRELVPPKDATE